MMDRLLRFLQLKFTVGTVTYSRADVLAVAVIGAMVSAWAGLATSSFSIMALLACEAMFFAYYLAGSLVAASRVMARGVLFELPLRLLVGYAIVNTAQLALAWLSPLGTVTNFGIVLGLLTLGFLAARRHERQEGSPASLWVVGLCAVATTLWCRDSLDPVVQRGQLVVYKPWIDSFYHAVHIRILAESHGASTIEDFRLAGVPARLYHYGVYMLPAFVKQVSSIPSYTAYAGILAPVSIFFTGLAAYAFFGSLFGAWPGLCATMALLLLPDGAQQGMQNPFMSYHWLTQISPSAASGLALLAVGWLFVLKGCSQGNRQQLFSGWALAGVVGLYKLHYVIASGLLLLLVPALFFGARLGWKKRTLFAVSGCGLVVTALWVGQKVPGVPLIRLNGSSIGEILHLVRTFHVPGALRDFMVEHMGRAVPAATNLLYGIPYVLLTALGGFFVLLVVLAIAVQNRTTLLFRLFPLLLLVNFLVMFFGLALDMSRSTPDELSHRPLIIVYFFVVAWVGGALGLILQGSRRLRGVLPALLVGVAAVMMVVPAHFGKGVQVMWAMPRISPVRLPASVVRVADYLRTHGEPGDIFQDSQFDRFCVMAALSERQSFVAHSMTTMPYRSEMVAARSTAIDRLMLLRLPQLVVGTARAFGIRWFVGRQGNRFNWPPGLVDKPVFTAAPFIVYDFK